MPVFLLHSKEGDTAYLDGEESRHLSRVLRLRKGDPVRLADGLGTMYLGSVIDPGQERSVIHIEQEFADYLKKPYRIHIAIAPTKSPDRFEWFLEKATEIGIDEITPILCDRSERSRIRMDRSEKILLSAMKQSGRARLPRLNDLLPLSELLRKEQRGVKFIAHCEARGDAGPESREHRDWLILIGPEGDFTADEIRAAKQEGYRELNLGEAVYRTETAGLIACQMVHFRMMDG